ncbi:glucose PTS transporter subunit EIIB [Halalkalibacter krulwichiae]|uniref:Negative regulator of SacY activity n=1 Tax=Halalkalibacter krulwichiae TaxID=199441 RepID=A0A1X9M5V3_9BACI|nr:glucose PTS transporter subunit EIIB [Halalkalibacter krulwichiae]ARK28829.1 Negative regulator of SacY activity [Halalkalibacter krulwichiae]
MSENKYERIGKELIQVIGEDNIESYVHCATRLRFSVKDRKTINDEAIEKIDEVKGVFYNAGQYQVILGTGTVNKVYSALRGGDQMKRRSKSHRLLIRKRESEGQFER